MTNEFSGSSVIDTWVITGLWCRASAPVWDLWPGSVLPFMFWGWPGSQRRTSLLGSHRWSSWTCSCDLGLGSGEVSVTCERQNPSFSSISPLSHLLSPLLHFKISDFSFFLFIFSSQVRFSSFSCCSSCCSSQKPEGPHHRRERSHHRGFRLCFLADAQPVYVVFWGGTYHPETGESSEEPSTPPGSCAVTHHRSLGSPSERVDLHVLRQRQQRSAKLWRRQERDADDHWWRFLFHWLHHLRRWHHFLHEAVVLPLDFS